MTRLVSAGVTTAVFAALSAAPAHASFPGANGLIAYSTGADAKQAQIYTMTAAGKDRRRITDEGFARNPAWSRSGEKLAFDRSESRDGRRALYVVDADGSELRRVPTGNVQASNPSWSRDGKRLAFQGCRGAGACDRPAIFVVRTDGSGLTRIAGDGDDPVWSPTGSWIAYHGKVSAKDACETLVRVKPSGARRTAILPRGRDEHDACSQGGTGADFSPDGRRLVYYGLRVAGYEAIENPIGGGTFKAWKYDPAMYSVGVDGKRRKLLERRSLGRSEWFLPPFAWSPDGRNLVWRDDRGAYVGRSDASDARRVSREGSQFAWQAVPGD